MGKSTINLLTNVKTAKVSLVKRGANKRQFAIFKSEKTMPDDNTIPMEEMEEIFKAIVETEAEGEEKLEDIFKQEKLSPKAMNAVKGALRLLGAYKEEVGGDLMKKLAAAAGYGYAAPKKQEPKKEPEKKQKKKDEEHKYPMAKALDGLPDELREQLEPVFKAQQDLYDEEIAKAEKHAEDADKRTEEVAKALKTERDQRQTQEWIAKSEDELSHFPGKSSEELGKMLKALHDVNPEMATAQFESMKAASDAIKESDLLKTAGTGTAPGGSAYQKIQEMVKAKIAKSGDTMTPEQAEVEIMKEDPVLYEKYLEENPAQSRPIMS